MRIVAFAAMACLAALLVAAGAVAQPAADAPSADAPSEEASDETPRYVVLRRNVSIPFATRTITGYRVGEDRSLLLDGIGNRWYRAELEPICARDLRFGSRIAVRPDPSGTLYRNNFVIINGRRCYIYSLDEIADPRPPAQEKAK